MYQKTVYGTQELKVLAKNRGGTPVVESKCWPYIITDSKRPILFLAISGIFVRDAWHGTERHHTIVEPEGLLSLEVWRLLTKEDYLFRYIGYSWGVSK